MHFYNEAYLLPWWLKHHYSIFDHGILIDYNSTDNSVEICKKLAPNWKIIPSRNTFFEAKAVDLEVMDIEKEINGWKIALNVTEFFVCRDINFFVNYLEQLGVSTCAIRGAVIVDPPNTYSTPPSSGLSLVAQRQHGYFEDRYAEGHISNLSRSRIFHRMKDGAYHPGRHQTNHPTLVHPKGATLNWFAFSPWSNEFINRKLQIKTKIPSSDRDAGRGIQHFVGRQDLEDKLLSEAAKASDLMLDKSYWEIAGGWSQQPTTKGSKSQFSNLDNVTNEQGQRLTGDLSLSAQQHKENLKTIEHLKGELDYYYRKYILLSDSRAVRYAQKVKALLKRMSSF